MRFPWQNRLEWLRFHLVNGFCVWRTGLCSQCSLYGSCGELGEISSPWNALHIRQIFDWKVKSELFKESGLWDCKDFLSSDQPPHLEQMENIPLTGPFLIAGNHVNSLDGIVMFHFIQPRPLTTLTKEENYSNPFIRILSDAWGAIPIKRGSVDNTAMNLALELERRKITGQPPEGTRSHTVKCSRETGYS